MSQQGKGSKKRYYRNLNILSLCRPVLLSGNVQSEHVATGEIVQTTILSLLSGNVQSEHVATGEIVQTTILSERYHFKTL